VPKIVAIAAVAAITAKSIGGTLAIFALAMYQRIETGF
jgi:flagellar biosynthesis protein FliQ